jgi:hypothetical protein
MISFQTHLKIRVVYRYIDTFHLKIAQIIEKQLFTVLTVLISIFDMW